MNSTLIAGLTAAAMISVAPGAAMAQEDQATNLGEVVVTGSRIRRNPTNSPTPLIQIGQEELLQSGEVNVIDFLADIPALSTSVVPEDTTGSNLNDGGLSLLSLRALGAVRTLVLVDGRRHVGSSPGSLSVDVDTIPRLLVANTEVITGGARRRVWRRRRLGRGQLHPAQGLRRPGDRRLDRRDQPGPSA